MSRSQSEASPALEGAGIRQSLGDPLVRRFNVLLALAIALVIFFFGPTLFLINAYTQSMGAYVTSFFTMATMTAETAPAWWMQCGGRCSSSPGLSATDR